MFKTNCFVFLKIIQYYPHCSITFLRKPDLRNGELSWAPPILKKRSHKLLPKAICPRKNYYLCLTENIFFGIESIITETLCVRESEK